MAQCTRELYGGNRDDVGYGALVGQLGAAAPNGAGVPVLMAEFGIDGGYVPLYTLPQFPNKTIAVRTPLGSNSVHATEVAENFFGVATSIAPGINQIEIYETNDFLTNGYMHWATSALVPNISPQASRVANHSWIASAANNNQSIDHLGRLDWLVHQDDFVQVVGVNNGPNGSSPIYSNSLNSIAVGLTNGNHPTGTLPVGGAYTAGRSKPDLVVPTYATSFAAPVVSASHCSADPGSAQQSVIFQRLVHAGTNPEPTDLPCGDVGGHQSVAAGGRVAHGIQRRRQHACSTIAAMHRCKRPTASTRGSAQGSSMFTTATASWPGANSNSLQDGGPQLVGPVGFDYDPSFGGAGGSNNTAEYDFIAGWTGQTLSASLVWNAKVDIDQLRTSQNKYNAVTLHNFDLSLVDITNPASPIWIASSVGTIQNTENILATLVGGHRYRMMVTTAGGAGNWDYGLAWTTVGTIAWGGGAGGVWKHSDANSTNWSRGYSAVGFVNGEHVVFNDAGSDSTVEINGNVAPASILVDNSIQNYYVQGGSMTGPTGLIKRGLGILGLNNNNTYTGPTIVENGWLRLDRSNALNPQGHLHVKGPGAVNLNGFDQSLKSIAGDGRIHVEYGGTLTVGTGNGNSEYSGIFTGGGNLVKAGAGYLVLRGTNSFDGDITVQGGYLTVAQNGVLGVTTGRTIVQDGGSLLLTGPVHYTAGELIELNGQGAPPGYGALENIDGNNLLAAHITLGSNSKISVSGGTLALTGSIDVPAAKQLTRNGMGDLTITGSLRMHDNSGMAFWNGTTVFAPVAASTVSLGHVLPNLQIGGGAIVRVQAGARTRLLTQAIQRAV